jgi:hypothetical protein
LSPFELQLYGRMAAYREPDEGGDDASLERDHHVRRRQDQVLGRRRVYALGEVANLDVRSTERKLHILYI